jgi:hypothetical protein
MNEEAVISIINKKTGLTKDVVVNLEITADELIAGLSAAYGGEYNYLICDNPPAFLKGSKTLAEYRIHNASQIII